MYGIYNSDALIALIKTVQSLHNVTTQKERAFAVKLTQLKQIYLNEKGTHTFALNSILYLTTMREKYVRMYERFIKKLITYSKAIRILSKGYLPMYLLPPSTLESILKEVRKAITKSNKDYDLVLTRLYLYYDMKLVTFGIDKKRNFNYRIPCICAALYPEKTDYVSDLNSTSSYIGSE